MSDPLLSLQACGSRGKALLEKAIRNKVSQVQKQAFYSDLCSVSCGGVDLWLVLVYGEPVLHRSIFRRLACCLTLDPGVCKYCMQMVSF